MISNNEKKWYRSAFIALANNNLFISAWFSLNAVLLLFAYNSLFFSSLHFPLIFFSVKIIQLLRSNRITLSILHINIESLVSMTFLVSTNIQLKYVYEIIAANDVSKNAKERTLSNWKMYISYFDFTTSLWATYTHRRRWHIRNSMWESMCSSVHCTRFNMMN